MKILVTGATGQLGSDLVAILGQDYEIIPCSSKDFDITVFDHTHDFIVNAQPKVIIHCGAFTDVDECEKEIPKSFEVNGVGTRNVAIVSREVGAKLFYISTDYVFDGKKESPYVEYDPPNPINIYGKSKLLGEKFVKEQMNKFFIIRTSWLYGASGKNFVKTMLNLARENQDLKVVNDQIGTPTWTRDVAKQIKDLIPTYLYATYHCSSQGSCSWYEFALEIFKQAGLSVKVNPVSSEEFSRLANRPKNAVLKNYMLKLQDLDIMPHWKDSLKKFMKDSNFELT